MRSVPVIVVLAFLLVTSPAEGASTACHSIPARELVEIASAFQPPRAEGQSDAYIERFDQGIRKLAALVQGDSELFDCLLAREWTDAPPSTSMQGYVMILFEAAGITDYPNRLPGYPEFPLRAETTRLNRVAMDTVRRVMPKGGTRVRALLAGLSWFPAADYQAELRALLLQGESAAEEAAFRALSRVEGLEETPELNAVLRDRYSNRRTDRGIAAAMLRRLRSDENAPFLIRSLFSDRLTSETLGAYLSARHLEAVKARYLTKWFSDSPGDDEASKILERLGLEYLIEEDLESNDQERITRARSFMKIGPRPGPREETVSDPAPGNERECLSLRWERIIELEYSLHPDKHEVCEHYPPHTEITPNYYTDFDAAWRELSGMVERDPLFFDCLLERKWPKVRMELDVRAYAASLLEVAGLEDYPSWEPVHPTLRLATETGILNTARRETIERVMAGDDRSAQALVIAMSRLPADEHQRELIELLTSSSRYVRGMAFLALGRVANPIDHPVLNSFLLDKYPYEEHEPARTIVREMLKRIPSEENMAFLIQNLFDGQGAAEIALSRIGPEHRDLVKARYLTTWFAGPGRPDPHGKLVLERLGLSTLVRDDLESSEPRRRQRASRFTTGD